MFNFFWLWSEKFIRERESLGWLLGLQWVKDQLKLEKHPIKIFYFVSLYLCSSHLSSVRLILFHIYFNFVWISFKFHFKLIAISFQSSFNFLFSFLLFHFMLFFKLFYFTFLMCTLLYFISFYLILFYLIWFCFIYFTIIYFLCNRNTWRQLLQWQNVKMQL